MLFDFWKDAGNYDQRCVARTQLKGEAGYISTARVSDGRRPIETAVKHLAYNDGRLVIVEAYDTVEEAQIGHSRWVKKMTAKTPPEYLEDIANSAVQQIIGVERFPRREKTQ